MDSHEWKHQLRHDHQHSANLPKLLHLVDQQQKSPVSALTLFTPEMSIKDDKTNITTASVCALPRMGYFSSGQRKELELQALIYKYMTSGATVPPELILPIKRSLLSASPLYHNHHLYPHFNPLLSQNRYWGQFVGDPEPGRCRRTDGKKWRCPKEVVAGRKFCERHAYRSRSRSRKHVEFTRPTSIDAMKTTLPSYLLPSKNAESSPSSPSPTLDILPLSQRVAKVKTAAGILDGTCSSFSFQKFPDDNSEGHILRRFFDDWPRSKAGASNTFSSNASCPAPATLLSISIPGSSSLSDCSLKLSTGNAEKPRPECNYYSKTEWEQQAPVKEPGWGNDGEAPTGGPLAEALRPSVLMSSPKSVLQKLNGSISEICISI